jgi:group II intron reverse transcriptase/maturase
MINSWDRVRDNQGCRGSDGITLEQFERDLDSNLKQLQNDLVYQHYHPFPLLHFPVPKHKDSGERYLSVPTVRDRIAQTAAFLTTREIFEAEFEHPSHAYREGRGVQTAIIEIKKWRDKGYRYAVDADIDDYFDSVSQELLLKKLHNIISDTNILCLFKKWIVAEIYDGQRIWTLEKGIPQGSVVSPLFANLFLDELDETLMSFGKKLVRYADNFLILSKSEAEASDNIELTDMILDDLQLDLNPLKTEIVTFDSGFKFLGAVFLHDDIYLPFPLPKEKDQYPELPPPLNLKRYLELKNC